MPTSLAIARRAVSPSCVLSRLLPTSAPNAGPVIWRHVRLLTCATSVVAAQATCFAADPGDVAISNPVVVTGVVGAPQLTNIELTASRPLSTLTTEAIRQVAPLTADFGTLANLLPSFDSSAPNG